jgi:hypothetical protein
MDINNTNPDVEIISNRLFGNKERQKALRQEEKELKAELLGKMTTSLHKDINGTIERISRKPKRIYDSDKLRAVLLKRGVPEKEVEIIIKASTRSMSVSEHLSVKVRRPN